MISLSDHDVLLLLLVGLAIDALFGDLPAVFAHVPHPVVLAGHAIASGSRLPCPQSSTAVSVNRRPFPTDDGD